MTNLFDYLKWRGDIPFDMVPVCEVDYLIFSRIAYIPFEDVVPTGIADEPVVLRDAVQQVLDIMAVPGHGRIYNQKEDELLLTELLKSERYSELKLIAFENAVDIGKEQQFSAITIILPDRWNEQKLVIAYRGTDGTIVGWKEDFNLCYAENVPSQLEAVRYIEAVADNLPGDLLICGHSKGGNLAMYASAFCREEVQDRILSVRNIDGPGFNEKIVVTDRFTKIIGRTKALLPQASIIGMLLGHAEEMVIVHSDKFGLLQHNVYLWEVRRGELVTVNEPTAGSQKLNRTVRIWMEDMEPELREKLVDGLYEIIASTDNRMLRELFKGRNTFAMIKAYGNLDEETKEVISQAYSLLRESIKKSKPRRGRSVAIQEVKENKNVPS